MYKIWIIRKMLTLIRKLQCYLSLIIKRKKKAGFYNLSYMFYYMYNENNKPGGVIFKRVLNVQAYTFQN